MICITGDIHGSHSIIKLGQKFFGFLELTKEDIVIFGNFIKKTRI